MKRVFVPNRGEIALRIVHACRELGLESVVGTSDVDQDGLAARTADSAVCIGPAPPAQSYLRDDVIVEAAVSNGCDAIHPGHGFLSDSPRLARITREHGLAFVGPPTEVIELTADKPQARAAADRAGVPVLPGQEVASTGEALEAGRRIGYPLLVKAAVGSGGRGIKLAHDVSDLDYLLGVARSEARADFGHERLYLERFIPSARHIEVQVAADESGTVVHLGERDCSVQRRYQKVVEEAPAPSLDDSAREALRRAAVDFAGTIGYRNLGTVEFLLDVQTGELYFLELSCSIQLEHSVTEAVSGRDLVALQLQLAGSAPLGFTQHQVVLDGHAIQCRLSAEDVAHGFMPSPGRLSLFWVPELANLRVDTSCYPGATIPPYYDPLLATLIAQGTTREAAIDVLIDALEDLDVEGVETNRTLLISVLGHDDFRRGPVTTDWLERAIVRPTR